METTTPRLYDYGSHVGDRIVWFDGSITVDPETVLSFIRPNSQLHTTHITADIKSYNMLTDVPITVKTELNIDALVDTTMNIPQKYKDMDVMEYLLARAKTPEEIERVEYEMRVYTENDQIGILQMMIYVIDTLIETNSVWGVGRGSSVSSYVLYLIGVHDINSIKYNLDFNDFISEPK